MYGPNMVKLSCTEMENRNWPNHKIHRPWKWRQGQVMHAWQTWILHDQCVELILYCNGETDLIKKKWHQFSFQTRQKCINTNNKWVYIYIYILYQILKIFFNNESVKFYKTIQQPCVHVYWLVKKFTNCSIVYPLYTTRLKSTSLSYCLKFRGAVVVLIIW